MNNIRYDTLNEVLYYDTLASGLTVFILPKQSYHKTYVTLSTPLGSNVTSIKQGAKELHLPLGIAHFLEHKLFDQDGEDISTTFAMQSAQVNAYTMNERTTYLFSCTEQLYENMATLLDFVFHPTFTTAGIKKEIGIISQEISMYQDDPNTAIYMGILRNMYHNHPVKEDILGTTDSISTITKELLTEAHSLCYHPSNMILFVAGNVDPDTMMTWLKEHDVDPQPTARPHERDFLEEPETLVSSRGEQSMDVIIPNALFGIKLPVFRMPIDSRLKWELMCSILGDMMVGKSTQAFQDLLASGLINDTFGMDVTLEQDYGFLLFGSNTKQPEEFVSELKRLILTLDPDTWDESHFLRCKKQMIGHFIQALNSLEYIANQFTKYHVGGESLFTVLDLAQSITMDDMRDLVAWIQDESKMTEYIIRPNQKTTDA